MKVQRYIDGEVNGFTSATQNIIFSETQLLLFGSSTSERFYWTYWVKTWKHILTKMPGNTASTTSPLVSNKRLWFTQRRFSNNNLPEDNNANSTDFHTKNNFD